MQTLLLLRALRAVLGTALHTALHALRVQSAADDVVTHTGEVLDTTASPGPTGLLVARFMP